MLRFHVNGEKLETDVPADTPLLWFLRDKLELTGTKYGCGAGLCGACTVHVDGQPLRSCSTPISAVAGKKVTTIEVIGRSPIGRKVQEAWLSEDVVQCGYCQSGQIMSAVALLAKNRAPSDKQIDDAMAGNICRCGTYNRVRAAIKVAAGVGAKVSPAATKPAAKAKA
jgi:isoquinoline 1-oxidoreductase alpha subunit